MAASFGIANKDGIVTCGASNITILEGSLLKLLAKVDQSVGKINIMNCVTGDFDTEGLIDLVSIYIIRPQIFYYLMALKDRKDRLQVLRNQNQRKLFDLKIGSSIQVTILLNKIQERVDCSIEYLGPISEIRCGHFIGLVIKDGVS